ncbi:alpha-amylase family glycosyl hydrolase [Streptomyces sp. NPDC089799]|uniref:malto-oligosyltrehalose synthase n=1 Tax=Streptomyces sp. NPDC089799 TaxID=3155066 RepID=UPI0034234E82
MTHQHASGHPGRRPAEDTGIRRTGLPADSALPAVPAVPASTYRIQLCPDFPLASARAAVPYLARLGVSHLHLSPVLEAVPGSTHGYDVVDHGRVRAELGGETALRELAATAREHGLGLVLDIVPNHMAVPFPLHLNRQLWEVLRDGPGSRYARWFDIDWEAGGGRVLLPLLADPPDGDAPPEADPAAGVLRYGPHAFPLRPGTEGLPLPELAAAQWYRPVSWREARTSLNYRRFFTIAELIGVRVEDEEVFAATHAKVLELVRDGVLAGLRIDHVDGLADPAGYLARLREAVGDRCWVVVEKILARTESLPSGWPVAGTTGYDALHRLDGVFTDPAGAAELAARYRTATGSPGWEAVARACTESVLDVDLASERAALRRLAATADGHGPTGAPRREPGGARRSGGTAERARHPGPAGDPVPAGEPDSTRHPDRAALPGPAGLPEPARHPDPTARPEAAGVPDPAGEPDPARHPDAAGRPESTRHTDPAGEPDSTRHPDPAALPDPAGVPDAAGQPDAALRALLVAYPVYRPYPGDDGLAAEAVVAAREAAGPGAVDRLIALLGASPAFAARFAQTSAALRAKSLEDRAFYRYAPLLSACEVGGDPGDPAVSAQEFHAYCGRLERDWPASGTVLSTHDTKRSADVRARIAVLSERPDALRIPDTATDGTDGTDGTGRTDGTAPPDPQLGWVAAQTSLGFGDAPERRERLEAALLKAVREAALHTGWTDPDPAYEATVPDRVPAPAGVPEDFGRAIRTNTLGMTALQLAMPGVPEVYQGCETECRTLVDPDNRRPVRFPSDVLARLDAGTAPDGLAGEKLALTAALLRLRRQRPALFRGYAPLAARGPASAHCLAFTRGADALLVAVTRLSLRLGDAGGWRDTVLPLPPGSWAPALSPGGPALAGDVPLKFLLGPSPVAVLLRIAR